MLTRVVRQLAQQNRPLLTAVLSSRTTNAMACRTLPSSTITGASPRKIDLSNIQDAVDLSNIQDAAAAQYTGAFIQGFQGDPVDTFSAGWAKEVMDHAMSAGRETAQERLENRQQGIQGDIEPPVNKEQTDNKTTVSNDSYRTDPTVSLYSVMQSQVPRPYGRDPTHLNMPGASKMRQHKYTSGMLHDTHPSRNLCTAVMCQKHRNDENCAGVEIRTFTLPVPRYRSTSMMAEKATTGICSRSYSGSPSSSGAAAGGPSGSGGRNMHVEKLSQKDKLKRAVKEYGATVIVFHVCISLASLGGFYLAVSRYVACLVYNQVCSR